MKLVIALRGIPGPSRHYYANRLKKKADELGKSIKIVSADQFFYNLGNNKFYAFDESRLSEAHEFCFKEFMKAIQDNTDIVVIDNSNIESWEIAPYRMYSNVNGYKFKIVEVHTDPSTTTRIQQHMIPPEKTREMQELMQTTLIPEWWERHTTELQPWANEKSIDEEIDKSLKDIKAAANKFKKYE